MPRLQEEPIGTGDQSWLGSTHALHNARTEPLSAAAFTEATHYPDGYIRSGQPLAIVGDVAVPYTAGAVDGSEVLAGFLATDQKVVSGDAHINGPVVDHGRIRIERLPVAFAVPDPANVTGQFVFIGTGA